MEELTKTDAIAVSTPELTYSNQISGDARQLIWHTFFESRNRGASFDIHFPWAGQKSNVTCVSLERSDDTFHPVIATLVILRKQLESGRDIGMIGLVCVRPEFRNKGLSTQLLTSAVNRATQEGLDALVLWTQKPDVYAKVGFSPDSTDLFGSVSKGARSKESSVTAGQQSVTPARPVRGGNIPPFADELVEFRGPSARLTCCKSRQGLTLVECHGELPSIVRLIDGALPDRWFLNMPEDARLIPALVSGGYQLDLKPSAVRMILPINPNCHRPIERVPFLERI